MLVVQTVRETALFTQVDTETFKEKAFAWASAFEVCCFLDSNQHSSDHFGRQELLIGAGNVSQLLRKEGNAFSELKAFHEKHQDWLFGFLSYDLKNEVEKLTSSNHDELNFPELHFFQPEVVIEIKDDLVIIHSIGLAPKTVFERIEHLEVKVLESSFDAPNLQTRLSKAEYLTTVEAIRQHIIEGDVYEMNFCQEFYAEQIALNPYAIFKQLNALAKAPFTCFYKLKDKFLLCASPERYLKKKGNELISQPIKGTIRRGKNEQEDQELREQLRTSEKDQAENVMIVDLVRNDLARICQSGSVKVEALFGIYPFEQVFQMISTIKGNLRPGLHFVDAIKNTFPMGSMTGAPKVMAMKLIEQYEKSKRGVYSGAVGYITPNGDFDFNVVIRSMLYNESKAYLSFQVGGAIVYDSVPEQEYEECLLKAKAILEVLNSMKGE